MHSTCKKKAGTKWYKMTIAAQPSSSEKTSLMAVRTWKLCFGQKLQPRHHCKWPCLELSVRTMESGWRWHCASQVNAAGLWWSDGRNSKHHIACRFSQRQARPPQYWCAFWQIPKLFLQPLPKVKGQGHRTAQPRSHAPIATLGDANRACHPQESNGLVFMFCLVFQNKACQSMWDRLN